MKKTFIAIIIIAGAFIAKAQNKASGYVYLDLNKNGKKDKNEKGINGVSVTNGKDVSLTNKKGHYELPIGEDNIIAVIKPSDYQIPLNDNNLPQYYYIHKPKGSPELKYPGVAPTGPLPSSIDFALVPQQQEDKFTALIFGDPQVYSTEQIDYFEKQIINEVKGIKGVSFGLSMGDEVGDKLDLFAPYTAAVAKVGLPWYNMMGNHDYNTDVTADSLSDESFEAHFGPATYAFNYGKVHFIILNDVLYPDPRDGRGYYGGLREDQFKFIENDLKYVDKDKLIVLAFHIPISEPAFLFRSADRKRLFELLKNFPYTFSLSAHTHMQRHDFFEKGEEWLQDKPHHHFNIGTTSGDWYSGLLGNDGFPVSTMRDGTPKGYGFIHFNGNQFTIDYKVAGKDASYQMLVSAPDTLKKDSTSTFYVNLFMGSQQDTAYYRIDNSSWKQLEYTVDYDPAYTEEVALWKSIKDKTLKGRRPSNPAKSKHLWKGSIGSGLEKGQHTIDIKISGLFGKTFTSKYDFIIID